MFSHFCIGSLLLLCVSGCTILEATGEAVGVVGKAAWAGTKAVGGIVYTGTSMAGQTANQTNKTLTRPATRRERDRVTVSGDRSVIPLEKEGKSYFVRARINDQVTARFLLDTGASALQISKSLAKRLKVGRHSGQAIPVTLAGGAMVTGRMIELEQVSLGDMTARGVKAIILDYEKNQSTDGLLGMSFLENFVFQIDTQRQQLILERR